jgi:HEAT repeat protein
MIRFFRNLRLDSISFLAGFIAATLLWLLLRIMRPALRKGWQFLKTWVQSARQGLFANTEQRHRIDTLKYVQGLHLASPIFSLDEVLIKPRLMAPPSIVEPEEPPAYEDLITSTIPFMPDWPELSAVYETNSLDVFEVLSSGSNIAIIGNPGIGKTTTLAYIATRLALQDPEAGIFQNYIPVFLHAAEIELQPEEGNDLLGVIIEAVSARASALTLPRLSEMLKTSFNLGQVILLVDGLDELAADPLKKKVEFLGKLLGGYPNIRVVAAASGHHVDGLPGLGFTTLPVASWGRKIQAKFIQQWGNLWTKFITPGADVEPQNFIDPILLNGWLLNLDPACTPFDFTLKVWAAYSGDARGPTDIDAIEAYIRRLIVNLPKARTTVEVLASEVLVNIGDGFTEIQAQDWLSNIIAEDDLPESREIILDDTETGREAIKKSSIYRLLPELIQNGLLFTLPNKKYYFIHPIISGYLAGFALNQAGRNAVFTQPSWLLREIALTFQAHRKDMNVEIRRMLRTSDDPLRRDRLTLGHWLKYLPREIPERKLILQQLTSDLQDESLTLGLRVRVLSALASSGDPGVPTLFRHLLNSQHVNVRQLAVLGCGYLRDFQSVGNLIKKLGDFPGVGQAACMALVNIGTKPALEAVATVLIQGDERLRRAAAESFANHPSEGYPILREGSTVDDLLTRRAVIYGLRRVNQPWATQILEELQIEDAQWVVKDAAAQAVTQINNPDPAIPKPQPPLEDLPWLIAFASDLEVGISEGKPAREMLLKALSEGNEDEKLAAMGQVRLRGETGIFPAIYHILYSDIPELKEAAFYTIWHIASTGYEIPPPIQFGLG